MSGSKVVLSWGGLFAAIAVIGTAVVTQQQELSRLAAERDALAASAAREAPKRVAMAATRPDPPLASPPLAPASHDAADRAALHRVHAEIDQLRDRVAARERALREFVATRRAPRPQASINEETLPYTDWTNAGRATPAAAIETVLWAGAGGDLGALDELLTFDEAAAAAARALFDRLPHDVRTEYQRPERIVALFTASNVPLTAARIVGVFPGAEQGIVVAQITRPEQAPRLIQFHTRADPADGSWRVVVPKSAIDTYAARLAQAADSP